MPALTAGIELAALVALAREAAAAILAIYHEPGHWKITEKADHSPLTAADLASQAVLAAGLARLTPDIPVLSEEGDEAWTPAELAALPRFWLVDPLDGTREFLKRNDEFAINIALVERGEAVFGLIHAPVAGYTDVGGRGVAPERWWPDGRREPLRVQARAQPPFRLIGSRSHIDPAEAAVAARLAARFGEPERLALGSALKFGLVAAGVADLYFRCGPTMWWDIAAGQAIVEAAGGEVCWLDGSAITYGERPLVNPGFVVSARLVGEWGDLIR